MSYILEGLKKLEKKRQQDAGAPLQFAYQSEPALQHKRNHTWPLVLAIIIVLNIAAYFFWNHFYQVPSADTRPAMTLQNNLRSGTMSQKKTIPSTEISDPSRIGHNARPMSPSIGQHDRDNSSTASDSPRQSGKYTSLNSRELLQTERVEPSGALSKSKPQTASKESRSSNVSDETKKDLPDLKMSLHYYSQDAKSRMVRINDRTAREGEMLDGGLKVVEILPSGVLLSYQGRRFLLGINENR